MFFKMFFCCSNSKLKEKKTITFEKLNSNEDIRCQDSDIAQNINGESSKNNASKDYKENPINYNINNIHHYVNNINNISLINNSSYYQRERSNKITNNRLPYINTIISNKNSFKSLLIKSCYDNKNNNNTNNNISINNINNITNINNKITSCNNISDLIINNNKNNNIIINNTNNSTNNINNTINNNNGNFQKAQSILSFSNLQVVKNTNTYNNDDTEILSPYELQLIGDIFFQKEIKIDRLGIKSSKIGDKRVRKEHLIKFGILMNIGKSQKDSDFIASDFKCKVDKESDNLRLDMNSITSSFLKLKDHNLDMILNLDHEKVLKLIDQNEQIINIDNKDEEDFSSPKIRKDYKAITLFTIRYIASMELFEFCSSHNSIPVELLLDFEYQLRNGYIYNILLGEISVILKVFKNKNDEDIIRIRIQDKNDDKNVMDNSNNNLNLSKKQEDVYNFNSSNVMYKYISIGRKNCTINIDNDTVSDTHLKIRYSDNSDTFSIIDGGSKYGSYLLLNEPFNYLFIKDILSFRLLGSKFNIRFIHNSE